MYHSEGIAKEIVNLDPMDQAILLIMVIRNCTSAYTTWIQMVKEIGENAISYKNVGKRMIKLWQAGMLKEVKLNVENIHGRKDYKLTMKAMELISSFAIGHPEEIENIMKYIDRFRLDKPLFGEYMLNKFTAVIKTLQEYGKYSNLYDFEYHKYLDKKIEYPETYIDQNLSAVETIVAQMLKHRERFDEWIVRINKYNIQPKNRTTIYRGSIKKVEKELKVKKNRPSPS